MAKKENRRVDTQMLEANDYSLKDYFSQDKDIIIPLYQREYSWEDKNMEVFIKDIYNNDKYYIGNIMTLPNKEKNIELIDGQQRMISTFLIFCCLKNVYKVNYNFSFLNEGKKIKIDTRAPSEDCNILEFIYKNDIPFKYTSRKEVKEYKKVGKTIESNNIDPMVLLDKLLNVIIVEIKFISSETDAHNMFVNLNTKGKVLENIDILKSQLFKYLGLDTEHGIQYYKEGWYETIKEIKDSNAQRYFDNFNDIYFKDKKEKNIEKVIKNICDLESAKKYYDSFCLNSSHKNGLCRCALTVYNHSTSYLNDIYSGNFSLSATDGYLKLLEEAKFKQFDVVLIPLLHISDNKNLKKFKKNYTFIHKFFKFILMHQEIMSIKKSSPAIYGNDFKTTGADLFEDKDYKKNIKEFLKSKLIKHNPNDIRETLKSLVIDHTSTKHARHIIMLLQGNIDIQYTVEHFILLNKENPLSMCLGNCIPVSIDNYGSLDIKNKLKKYNQNKSTEPFIKNFLKYKIDDLNYRDVIKKRNNDLIEEYVNEYESLYSELKGE